jgi:hypothetical protein
VQRLRRAGLLLALRLRSRPLGAVELNCLYNYG